PVWVGEEGAFLPLSKIRPPKLPSMSWQRHGLLLSSFLRDQQNRLVGDYAVMLPNFIQAVYLEREDQVKGYFFDFEALDPWRNRPSKTNKVIGVVRRNNAYFAVTLQKGVFWLWDVFVDKGIKGNTLKFNKAMPKYGLKAQQHPTREQLLEVGIVPVGYNPVTGTFSKPLDR
ncbi:MAG: hypothetical protein EBU84_16415, partial [Actinobacteria bacterium]|nr:hypothetical protein [Actinomycetota bacterium]